MAFAYIRDPNSRDNVLYRSGQARSPKHSFAPTITRRRYEVPPAPPRFTYSRARALRKLVLREDASLDSERCGAVAAGTSVLVLKEVSALKRVHVGSDFAEGVRPLGWVTCEKDGDIYLHQYMEPAPVGADLNCSSRRVPISPRARVSPRPTRSQERLSHHRDPNGNGGGPTPSFGGGSSSSAFLRRLGEAEQRDEVQQSERNSPEKLGGLLSSSQLMVLADEQLSKASDTESVSFENFRSKLGRIILAKGGNVNDLAHDWDRNGDGSVTKFEFCVGVRKLLDKNRELEHRQAQLHAAENSKKQGGGGGGGEAKQQGGGAKERTDIEEMFDSFDRDGSGELDLPELKGALRTLARDVSEANEKAARQRDVHGARLRNVAASLQKASAAMAELEASEKALTAMRHPPGNSVEGLEARLGGILRARNLRVGDVIREWDEDSSGDVSRTEFFHHLAALGLKGLTSDESNALFDKLDEDGSGTLEVEEVRHALKNLQDAATKAAADEKAQSKLVADKRKAARTAQALAQKMLKASAAEAAKAGV